jgi:hypothetical protein
VAIGVAGAAGVVVGVPGTVVTVADAGHHGLVGTPAQGSGIVGRSTGSGRMTGVVACG